jgi:ABC-type multidrug transport system permease subunit
MRDGRERLVGGLALLDGCREEAGPDFPSRAVTGHKIVDVSATERIELTLLATGLIFIVAGAAQARYRFIADRRPGRRFYWATSIIGIVSFAAGVGKIWPNAVVVAAIFSAIVVFSAYLTTPYLKIGGRIYASSPENRQPDP